MDNAVAIGACVASALMSDSLVLGISEQTKEKYHNNPFSVLQVKFLLQFRHFHILLTTIYRWSQQPYLPNASKY